MNKQISHQHALITGASSGIGKELAIGLAKRGITSTLVARREQKLVELCQMLKNEYQVNCGYQVCDLSQTGAANDLFSKLEQHPTILINNAGIGRFGGFTDFELEDHHQTIQLNISALTDLCYKFLHAAEGKNQQHYIMNIASLAAFVGVPNYAVYSGTKRYVRHFSEVLRYELKGKPISISCICPGGTQTEFMSGAGQIMKEGSDKVMMDPKDVAEESLKAMFSKKFILVPGMSNKFVSKMGTLIPSGILMDISHKVMRKFAAPKNLSGQ